MASENAPVLFPARLPEGMPRHHQRYTHRSQSIASQLIQTIAATLNAPDALPRLAEVLGTQLAPDGCLIMRYHRVSQNLYYTFWQPNVPVQARILSAKSRRPQEELQCWVACSLLQRVIEPSAVPNRLTWQEGLETVLAEEELILTSLDHIQTYQALPISSAPDMDAVVVLLYRSCQPPQRLDKIQEMEISSLIAIALHQHDLQHQNQRCNEQINYLNYLKEDFLSTLNHELRTPLTSMMLAIRMLRRPDLTPERAARYLDILEQQCSQETNLVNDLLMLQSVSVQPATVASESINLGSLLEQLKDREQGQFTRSRVSLEIGLPDHAVMVQAAGDHLSRILQELLTNARKYSAPQSTTTVTLLDQLNHEQSVCIRVTSTGAGIQPEEIPHIFDKFRRGQNATKNAIPGTGTGLALVKGLVEQLGGTVSVTSQPCDGQLWRTCFAVELPTGCDVAKCSYPRSEE